MYGNSRASGVAISEQFRNDGSLWRSCPESTWLKLVKVNGATDTAAKIPLGTVMKELITDGTYTPITESDIISAVAGLPGARLGIVADTDAETGVTITTTEDSETVTEVKPSTVLIGIHGQVDKAKIFIGDKLFSELTAAQQICLNTQLEAWGFQLIDVVEG